MKITRIVPQVRQQGRYSLYIDGSYAFSLGEAALLESHLAVGTELDEEGIKRWKQEAVDEKLYNRALRYAAMRFRSVWELKQYLKRKGVPPALSEKIVSKLSNIGVLDDQKFATTWVASRRLLRPTSMRKLQQELRLKRISEDLIKEVLKSEREDESELAGLRRLVAKKQNLPRYKVEPQRLVRYLMRQGFHYEDIQSVLHAEVLEESSLDCDG